MAKTKEAVNIINEVASEAEALFKAKAHLSIEEGSRKQIKDMISQKAAAFKDVSEYTENNLGNGTVLCVSPPYTAYMADKTAILNYLSQHNLLEGAIAANFVQFRQKQSSRITLSKQCKAEIEAEIAKRLPAPDIELPELCKQYISVRDNVESAKNIVYGCMEALINAADKDDLTACAIKDQAGNNISFNKLNSVDMQIDLLKTIIPEADHNLFRMIERNIKEPVITIWDEAELAKAKEKYGKTQGEQESEPEL